MKTLIILAITFMSNVALAECRHQPSNYHCQELVPNYVQFEPKCWNGYEKTQQNTTPSANSGRSSAEAATIYTWSCTKS